MKNVRFLIYGLVSLFVLFPTFVYADIINNNGVTITDEEYENFLKIYSSEYIMNMTSEKYERLLDLDFDDIISTTKYIAQSYNPNLNLVTERELTKEEYENFEASKSGSRLATGAVSSNETSKSISMALVGGTTWNYATLTTTWNYIPGTRSYDVTGFRGYGFSFRNGSQTGEQIYILNGNYTTINYAWNGTNIQRYDNGFGISMNLVNSSITALQTIVDCDVSPTIDHPQLFGAYEHALSDVTLAESQSYTLSGSGYGSVFLFPYATAQKYDGMIGLILTY